MKDRRVFDDYIGHCGLSPLLTCCKAGYTSKCRVALDFGCIFRKTSVL